MYRSGAGTKNKERQIHFPCSLHKVSSYMSSGSDVLMLGLLAAPRSAQGSQGIFKTPDEIRIVVHVFGRTSREMMCGCYRNMQ